MRAGIAVLGALLALAGCAAAPGPAPERSVVVEKVLVPVREPCLRADQAPAERTYPDQEIAADAPLDALARAVALGLLQRDQDIQLLRAAISGCME